MGWVGQVWYKQDYNKNNIVLDTDVNINICKCNLFKLTSRF